MPLRALHRALANVANTPQFSAKCGADSSVAIVIDNKKEIKEFLVTYLELRSSLTETMLKDQVELVSACDKHLEENGRLLFVHVDARLRHGVEEAFGAINQALKVTTGPAGMKA